jgi:hypothetical protein
MHASTPNWAFTIHVNEVIVLASMFSAMLKRLIKKLLKR